MRTYKIVGNSIIWGLLATCFFAPLGALAQSTPGFVEFVCTATDVQERLPPTVRFRILTVSEIEARAFDKDGKESKPSVLRKSDPADRSRAAVFPMGGQLGVSGDVRMLIANSALSFGEVGTIMITNQSTREHLAYQCAKEDAKEARYARP